jgi:putative glutamine amidotransferase
VADALKVEARHVGDGIVGQVRLRDYPRGVGVQFHPERDVLYGGLPDDLFAQRKYLPTNS